MTSESITLETLTAPTPRAARDLLPETLCRQETDADQRNRLVDSGLQYDSLTATAPPEPPAPANPKN